jgi:hypothetical protein
MLDTQTGELWNVVINKDNMRVLTPIPYSYGEDRMVLSPTVKSPEKGKK